MRLGVGVGLQCVRNDPRHGQPPKPLHLTASMKVIHAHQRRRHVTIADTRRAVQEAALRVADGTAGLESISLAAQLEKMTGVSIRELAVLAEDWPETIGRHLVPIPRI